MEGGRMMQGSCTVHLKCHSSGMRTVPVSGCGCIDMQETRSKSDECWSIAQSVERDMRKKVRSTFRAIKLHLSFVLTSTP